MVDAHSSPGAPWALCPRSALKRLAAQLKEEFNLVRLALHALPCPALPCRAVPCRWAPFHSLQCRGCKALRCLIPWGLQFLPLRFISLHFSELGQTMHMGPHHTGVVGP